MSRGRKRKAGKREPNGRLKRDSRMNTGEKPNAMAMRETVALQRCRLMGWGYAYTQEMRDAALLKAIGAGTAARDLDNLGLPVVGQWIATAKQHLEAMDPACGTVEGRLWKGGKITREQYDAATAYSKHDARHRKVVGIPMPTPKAANMAGDGGSTPRDPFDVDEKSVMGTRSRQGDFVSILRSEGALTVTMCVVLHQQEPREDMLDALRRGLNAIYRGMVDTRRVA